MSDKTVVEKAKNSVEAVGGGCPTCNAGHLWTVSWTENGEAIEAGQAWGDKQDAEDVCEYMNQAHAAAYEESAATIRSLLYAFEHANNRDHPYTDWCDGCNPKAALAQARRGK